MKKSIYCLSTLCIAIGLGLTSCSNENEEEEIFNGMWFNANDMRFKIISVEDQTCEICKHSTGYSIYWGDITIPGIVTYQGRDFMVIKIGSSAFSDISQVTSVSIPSTVTTIGGSAFRDCTGLTNVSIPSSVTNIGGGAFMGCSSLTNIDLPNSLISIDENAFLECTNLQSVRIPNSITTISNGTFNGCTELTEVTIPNSVTTIDHGAFSNTGLTNVTIPNSVMNIGPFVFAHCNLKEMVFEDGEEALEAAAAPLGFCTVETLYVGRDININSESDLNPEKLSKLIIGKQLTSMPNIEFYSLTDLESIYLMPNNPPAAQEFSIWQYENVRVYVPEGRLFAYRSDNVWSQFKNIQEFDPSSLSDRYNSPKQDL